MSRKTRKLIWSAPLVAALAVLGALAIFAAQLPGTALAHEPPGIVTDIDTKTDGPNAIEISWTGASAATSYRIDYSMDGHVWKALADGVTGTRHTHMGVPPDVTRYYRVFAINSAGVGPMSEIMSGETDAGGRPGSVTGLKATRMGHNAIKLEWQAPAENGGYAIMHYDIHAARTVKIIPVGTRTSVDDDKSDGEALVRTMDAALTYDFDELTPGATWSFQVYAVNKNPALASNKSGTAPTTRSASTAKQTEPSEPTGLLAVADGKNIKLYWYWPRDVGGAADADVDFYIEGHHTDGEKVTGWADVVTAKAYSRGDVMTTIDYMHENPAPGTWKYRITTVTGEDADLMSKVSAASSSVTTPNVATSGNRVLLVPDNLKVTEERGNIVLTWEKVEPPVTVDKHLRPTRYRIDVSEDGVMWHRVPASAQPTQLTKTVYSYDKARDGLKADASRVYRVFPQLGSATGPAQANPEMPTATTVSAPSAVPNVQAEGISATEIRVTWEPPEEDGQANIAHYLIDYGANRQEFPTKHEDATAHNRETVAGNVRSYTHEVDNGGTTVYFRVFAKNTMAKDCKVENVERCSPFGTADEVSGTSLKADLPTAPVGLTVETAGTTNLPNITDRGVLLLWNAPDDPAGGDVNGYTVQRKVVGTDADFVTLEDGEEVSKFETYFTDTELPVADEMRAYRVRAYNNDAKPGPWSNTAYYPVQMHEHEPTEPTNVMASSDATGELMLTWEGGANADSYLLIAVNMADTSDYETMIVSDGAAQMGTVTGLTSGVNYLGIVVALQGTGADQTFAYGASGVQAVQ